MTPLMIDIATWYYCRIGDYGKDNGDNNFSAPAVQSALKEFADAGLLTRSTEPDAQQYYRTEALAIYVNALCKVPWPVQKWVMPDAA